MGADRLTTARPSRLRASARHAVLVCLLAAPLSAQTPPSTVGPRDFRPEARGAATIRGRVTVDGSSTPVRGARVRAIPRSAGEVLDGSTNENGWFEFTGLSADRWTFEVEKGGYLPGHFGQRTPTGPGTSLTVAAGETHAIAIPLIKGAAIAGQLVDGAGEPAVGARVQAMRWTTVEGQRVLTAAAEDQTDDTGSFRLHTLPPGDYVVLARGGPSQTVHVFTVNTDGRSVHVVSDGPGAEAEFFAALADRAAAPTYFPGVAAAGDAQRVTLRRGEERTGVSFALSAARLARISGTMVSSSGSVLEGHVTVSLLDASGQSGNGPVVPGSRRTDGAFEFRDVPPGSYLLVGAHGATPGPGTEFAMMPIVVGGEDLTGLTLITRQGGAVRGVVTTDGAAPPDTDNMGVYARPLRRGAYPLVDIGTQVRGGRFEIPNIAGVRRLQFERLPPGWAVKSIAIDNVDVTDVPIDFTNGARVNATVVLTNRLTRLAGVATLAGKPAGQATVIVFAADPARWAFPSRYVQSVRADDSGNYAVAGLPPAQDYLAAAIDEYESGMELDPEFLERLRAGATRVALAEGESRRLDLAIVGP